MAKISRKLRMVVRTTVAEQALAQIRELIESGEYGPGDQLPTERELAERMGISRAPIREALRSLETTGLVRSRSGSGTFVSRSTSLAGRLMLQDPSKPADLFEIRQVLEPAAAELAAHRRNEHELEILRLNHLEIVEAVDSGHRSEASFFSFHVNVAAASHNPAMLQVIKSVQDRLDETVWTPLRATEPQSGVDPRDGIRDHERILSAVDSGDGTLARDLMAEHLGNQLADLWRGEPG